MDIVPRKSNDVSTLSSDPLEFTEIPPMLDKIKLNRGIPKVRPPVRV